MKYKMNIRKNSSLIFSLSVVFYSLGSIAQSKNLSCSDSVGKVRWVELTNSEDQSSDKQISYISINVPTLAGMRELRFPVSDLKVQTSNKKILARSTSEIPTICDIPQKTKSETYTIKLKFSKSDGSNLHTGDTSLSDIKQINDYLICEQDVTQAWPCP